MRGTFAASFLLPLLTVSSPVQADVPDPDGICDGDEAANVDCEVIAGPASLTVKSVLSVGIGFCQAETTDIPLQCAGQAGDVNGVGAATFGDATWIGDRDIAINVVHDQGTCTAATSPPCGFTVEICNDADQDSTCTNIGDQDDQLFSTAASEGALGTCKDEQKGCADPNEAGWEGCMEQSVFADWSADQIVVFIGVEAGPSLDPPDVQAAVSVGTYTVWMEDQGATTCFVCSCDFPTGCIWERDPGVAVADGVLGAVDYVTANGAASDPGTAVGFVLAGLPALTPTSEACADDVMGNPLVFFCAADAEFMVVLHIGLGSTSATSNGCSGQDPQTASTASPLNVQGATGPATFQCHFTWVVAGAGACIWV